MGAWRKRRADGCCSAGERNWAPRETAAPPLSESVKETVPVGVATPCVPATVAVMVTGAPAIPVIGNRSRVVVVCAGVITW